MRSATRGANRSVNIFSLLRAKPRCYPARVLKGGARALTVGVLALAATAAAAPRHVRAPRLDTVDGRIVNGVTTTDFPATGALLDGGDPSSAAVVCSGTLIGCSTFLTAGHCVDASLDPADYTVYLQHAGFHTVTAIARHPDYDFPVGDVAVLTLGTPVSGIRPMPIATENAPSLGTTGTIVGFGRSGGSSDFGIKRRGTVTTGPCANGVSDATSVCWTFAAPLGAPGANSNTCNADSGGPLFVDGPGGPVIAGVTSGGATSNCAATDHSYDASIYAYREWIAEQAGADLGAGSCGAVEQVGQGAAVTTFTASLGSSQREGRHAVDVPAGRSELRITFNAIDDGVADFDLYVKHGSPATTADYDCAQNGIGQFGSCLIDAPAAGRWYVLVDRYAGSGAYQVTATTFGVDCAAPGSDGVACDDGSPCTTGDACAGGVCTGAALPDGSACDDGRLCTPTDACVAGACVGSEVPATGCIGPAGTGGRGAFVMQDGPHPNTGDRLTWRWIQGAATPKAAFGTPTTTSNYGLCVYDDRGDGPTLVLERRIAAGSRWRDVPGGFRYSDPALLSDGVRRVNLREGGQGAAKITLEARGPNLAMPPVPLGQQTAVTVQLVHAGACWEARYSTSVRNTAGVFRARPD